MHLHADEIYADPREPDYPDMVGFHDHVADWCLIFCRFSDLEPDDGRIQVVVRDQIHARTANLRIELNRSQCHVLLDEATASELLGIHEYVVDFEADEQMYRLMADLFWTIFEGLPGPTITS